MLETRTRTIFLLTVTVAVLGLSACSKGSAAPDLSPAPIGGTATSGPTSTEGQNSPGSITATEKDFSISLPSSSAAAGETTITAANQGPSTHQLVLLKTDDAPDSLPLDSDGLVDDQTSSVKVVGQAEDVTPGSSKTFTANLEPGKYVLICNLPGHYKLGMYAGLTVA